MASIYKRGNSNIYYVALFGPDGKRMHLSTKTTIRKEAEKRAILIEDKVKQGLLGEPGPGKRMKVKDLLKKYKVEISVDRKDRGREIKRW